MINDFILERVCRDFYKLKGLNSFHSSLESTHFKGERDREIELEFN